jgi:hypothetical protein
MHHPGNRRSRLSRSQLLQGNRPEHDPNLLNTGVKNLPNGPLILADRWKSMGRRDIPQYRPKHSQ